MMKFQQYYLMQINHLDKRIHDIILTIKDPPDNIRVKYGTFFDRYHTFSRDLHRMIIRREQLKKEFRKLQNAERIE